MQCYASMTMCGCIHAQGVKHCTVWSSAVVAVYFSVIDSTRSYTHDAFYLIYGPYVSLMLL